jgi:beta-lactamase class A
MFKSKKPLVGVLFATVVFGAGAGYVMTKALGNVVRTESSSSKEAKQLEEQVGAVNGPNSSIIFEPVALQDAVDTWVASLPAGSSASIVVTDSSGNSLASSSPDRIFFAASIYKLYVAYAGYQQVDQGLVDGRELYVDGNTRVECLDLMIRESDNPCAEKLWEELGKQLLTSQLKTYGIVNTSMVLTNTTAADVASMLGRIAHGEGLSAKSQSIYLESMKTQIYRDGLNAGFSDAVTVYNKVGFNEGVEYHDAAIIKLSDGRQAIISVMTENVGTTRIAELARAIEERVVVN